MEEFKFIFEVANKIILILEESAQLKASNELKKVIEDLRLSKDVELNLREIISLCHPRGYGDLLVSGSQAKYLEDLNNLQRLCNKKLKGLKK